MISDRNHIYSHYDRYNQCKLCDSISDIHHIVPIFLCFSNDYTFLNSIGIHSLHRQDCCLSSSRVAVPVVYGKEIFWISGAAFLNFRLRLHQVHFFLYEDQSYSFSFRPSFFCSAPFFFCSAAFFFCSASFFFLFSSLLFLFSILLFLFTFHLSQFGSGYFIFLR